jgi:hypothetical protein
VFFLVIVMLAPAGADELCKIKTATGVTTIVFAAAMAGAVLGVLMIGLLHAGADR